jgi:BolA family transcriptional regulator, general stress-responsive regulator
MKAQIERLLTEALQPLALEVQDDSHLHAGHAGAREGGHYSVHIVAAAFAGLNRVARHRLVYDSLNSVMPRGIHALAIVARAPDEAASSLSPHPAPSP